MLVSSQRLFTTTIHQGWSFKESGDTDWLPVQSVPTNVHLDIINAKKIDDPFLDFNELKCQWVGERTWLYRVTLPKIPSGSSAPGARRVLVFDGLDTFATVRLNSTAILTSNNMFIMHRVDVTEVLRDEAVLEIEFKPALLEARKIQSQYPDHKWVGFNGEMSRLAVRKAQYHWGWDWGPVLMTCGPWRGIRLETYIARVADFRVDYEIDFNGSHASVCGTLTAWVEGVPGKTVRFVVQIHDRTVLALETLVQSDGKAEMPFEIRPVELWFPRGFGPQPLYIVTATVLSSTDIELHSFSHKTGFRKAQLIQQPDSIGSSFFFRINNHDVFCGGSDWIPADSFTPRISPEKYRKWIQTLADGFQVMVRVWGGGIWEDDAFYDACDELGVLVWQDFMFGCGNYPAFPEFLDSIKKEAICQTKRLRHHPSIVLYAGNNEDYQVQEQYKLTYDYGDKDPANWLRTDFPARYIYEKLLPDVAAAHTAHIPYHPGSPWGKGKISSNPTVGDMHQWNVWHGTQEKYQIFDQLGGRFNSEFGMEAFPHIATIESFVTGAATAGDKSRLHPQSHVLDFHNKADGHERRIATYLVENFQTPAHFTLAKHIHLTQLCQAETLVFGYSGWRRQWGQERRCGGALVWQTNDCWPTISWSIIDYYLRKKAAYYALRRVLAPLSISVRREHHDWSVVHAKPATVLRFECWVSSSRLDDVSSMVELRFISIATGRDIKDKVVREMMIKANGTTEILHGTVDNLLEEPHVLAARLFVDGTVVSRFVDWPQPLKYLDLSSRGVVVETTTQGQILVKADKPAKGLVFEEREGVSLSDSALDVVPGDEQVINAIGLGAEEIKTLGWTYLGQP